jgi:general stress protein CsbA
MRISSYWIILKVDTVLVGVLLGASFLKLYMNALYSIFLVNA